MIHEVRAAILDGLYKPGERLLEAGVAAKIKVSRSRCAKPCKRLVRPLSSAEFNEIAEIRLALIALILKPAHPQLAPADFDLAYELGLMTCEITFTPRSRPNPSVEAL